MLFKFKLRTTRNGAKCPIKITAAHSRGYIAPGNRVEVPVSLVEEVRSNMQLGPILQKLTTFQVRRRGGE
jgi:hypothetical protein